MAALKPPIQKDVFGFQEKQNQTLYRWLAIPFFVFCALMLPKLSFSTVYCKPGPHYPYVNAATGECYYYLASSIRSWGIWIHLASVLPSGLLAVLQFTPAIRRYRRFHRVAGYVSTALAFVGIASVAMFLDKTSGGDVSVVTIAVATGFMSAYALYKGVMEARAKRLASHRAWMIRAWMYLGTILTMRVFMPVLAVVISVVPGLQQVVALPCGQIVSVFENELVSTRAEAYREYPVCAPENIARGLNPTGRAPVMATFFGSELEIAAVMFSVFGSAMWIALLLHVVGTEMYLGTTKGGVPAKKVTIEQKVHIDAEVKRSGVDLKGANALAGQDGSATLRQAAALTS